MKKLLFIIFLVTLSLSKGFSQNIDSLKLALKNAKNDTTKINILSELSEICEVKDILTYAEPCVRICEEAISANTNPKVYYLKHLADALNYAGVFAQADGNITKAIEYYHKSLQLREEIKDKEGIAYSLGNIGFIYMNQGDIPKALEYSHKSLQLQEEIKDKEGIANSLNNIGCIYANQGDITKALDYHHKSLKIHKEIKDKEGIATSLGNIGYIYGNQGDPSVTASKEASLIAGQSKSLEYHHKSLKIQEEIKDKEGIAYSLSSIGVIYNKQGDLPKALAYFHKSLQLYEELKNKWGIAHSLNNIARVMFKNGSMVGAHGFAKRSLQIAKELGYPDNINKAASTLKDVYKKQNNYAAALEMYELEIQMRDSINNETTKKASIQKQFQYEYEKQAAADSIKNAEEQKVKNAQLTAQKAELKQEKTKSYALYGGLALVLIFAGFMVNRFRVTNKQKQVIELKEIETQKQNEIITHQKKVVEEKHKEITDSINYAERIQRSFLATTEMLDQHLKDYFVFFRPKDVVSGDFYWAGELNNGNFAFSVADSTGHGVPGAIMSILNISSLEKSIEKETAPDKILNKTRKIIIERLKKDGSPEGGKDGMDCSLLVLNQDRTQLSFAAANNPVFIVRDKELIEFKPDKMPVGKHDNDKDSFTLHSTMLKKGDVIYSLTDGFPDQFGGDKGKKYMIKNLKEFLLQIAHLPMLAQEQKLAKEFDKWKGSNEQVDDVCIIGVRV